MKDFYNQFNNKFIRYSIGKPLVIVGIILGYIGGIMSMLCLGIFVLKSYLQNPQYLLLTAVGIALHFFGRYIFSIGKKITALRAEYLMSQDTRNPVLYLRSFKDDKEGASLIKANEISSVIDPFSSLDNLLFHSTFRPAFLTFSSTTEEEEIAKGLHWVGPCIAAGIPGERLPSGLGMARFYMEEDNWEKEIKKLMLKAELVLMRAGTTKSFIKELRIARELINPRKLLIILPFDCDKIDGDEKSFVDIANEILPRNLPQFTLNKSSETTLSGILWFQNDWTPEITNLFQMGGFTIRPTFEGFSTRYMNSEKRYFYK